MAATIGNLVVRLGAVTGPFHKKMGQAQGGLRRLGGGVLGLARRLGPLAAGFTGVAGAAGMALMVRRSFKTIDATAKLSDQIGVTTEKLQGLRHAAELTGAGSKTLDAGLQTMAKRLGEAARGSGAAKPALDEMGLSAKRLIKMAPDAAFYEIAEGLEAIESPARRNAIAANLFSKANMGLLNTLSLGKKGLADVQKEAERLGIAYSRADAAKIEKANDSILRMKQAFMGVFQTIAIKVAPAVTMLAEGIPKFGSHMMRTFRTVFNYIGQLRTPFQTQFRDAFQNIAGNLDVLLGSFEGFRGGVIHAVTQTTFAFQAAWENAYSWLKIATIEATRVMQDAWWEVRRGVAKYAHLASPAAFALAKAFPAQHQAAVDKMLKHAADDRLTSEQKANKAIADERKRHVDKVLAIGQASLDQTAAWEKRMGNLPRLSTKWLKAWYDASRTAGPPGIPGLPEFAGLGMGGAGEGRKYAAAEERESTAAYRSIIAAMGQRREPIREVAKHTRAMVDEQKKTNDRLDDIANRDSGVTEIPD